MYVNLVLVVVSTDDRSATFDLHIHTAVHTTNYFFHVRAV